MNEFLEQFLLECRELSQQATNDLLALEKSPPDRALIDGVFRGFHTLKGAAGIVDFAAMSRLVHAAESILEAVRRGSRAVSVELIGDCLACLDQVEQWLDLIEAEGELPTAPDAAADALIARFAHAETPTATPELMPDWAEDFLTRHSDRLHAARVALRYTPDGDCFFRGEDPLDLIGGLPDLLAVDVRSRGPWPPLETLDPFECNLVITALTATPVEAVRAALIQVLNQVETRPLPGPSAAGAPGFPAEALAVLEEQLLLLDVEGVDGFAGRLGSAFQVAMTVLRNVGQPGHTLALETAFEQSQHEGTATAFATALRLVLDPRPAPVINEPAARSAALHTLRVDVGRIDTLVSLTGELTIAKNALGHIVKLADARADPALLARTLKDQHAVLDRLVGELRRSVLEIRVLPLRHVFQRFPRLVREMASDLGKSVELVTEGETTEADKATVEALFEPILHVLRNAVDHGVEPEAERNAAGKTPSAQIRLRALRDGDTVVVEISDDGRGIDTVKVRRIAAERGLAMPEALTALSDAAAIDLIFVPGFSTAATVTHVSGRGVGMDAVRSAIARLGGRVTVASESGKRTSVRFTLPFTVMMVRIMTVEVRGQMFGIPLDAVVETVLVPCDRIARLGAAEVFAFRERTLPVIRLAEVLGLPGRGGDRPEDARVVVVSVAGQTGGVEVDGFGERMDVMLRPMDGLLSGRDDFAGTTVLGDGRVLIVLDLSELLR